MTLLLFISLASVLGFTQAIDINERIGTCISDFTVNNKHYINAIEGVWFPQYRTRTRENDRYSCHVSYAWMRYEKSNHTLRVRTFHSFDGIPQRESSEYAFKEGEKRRVLIGEDLTKGVFPTYNYIIKMTNDYIVRYICQNNLYENISPTVYIETRRMRPNLKTILEAVDAIKLIKLNVTLDRIVQHGCKRPMSRDQYKDSNE